MVFAGYVAFGKRQPRAEGQGFEVGDRRRRTGVGQGMEYKFQRLDVYRLGLDYIDKAYAISRDLTASQRFNLGSQLERAATSIVLNIAEGSTGQSDAEQKRFLGLAVNSEP